MALSKEPSIENEGEAMTDKRPSNNDEVRRVTPDEITTGRETVTDMTRDAPPAPPEDQWDTRRGSRPVKRAPMAVARLDPVLKSFLTTIEESTGFAYTDRDLPKARQVIAACAVVEKKFRWVHGVAELMVRDWLNQDPETAPQPKRLDLQGFFYDFPRLLAERREDWALERARDQGMLNAAARARTWTTKEWRVEQRLGIIDGEPLEAWLERKSQEQAARDAKEQARYDAEILKYREERRIRDEREAAARPESSSDAD